MNDKYLNTLVIENSKVQRTVICQLVRNHDYLILSEACSNAIDASRIIKNNRIDLILLDIEMPYINGFDLLASLDNNIQVMIITANPNHALKAFDYGVTDYLLKPVKTDRFYQGVKKVLTNYSIARESFEEGEYLWVRSNLKKRKLNIKEIKWIEALGDYVKIITDSENLIVLSSMKSISDKLPKDRFLRIHRSYIVNLNKVEKFGCTSVEVGQYQLPMSRKQKTKLELLLEKVDN
ncbi:MAG: response regulator transcription factor [Flavobacteriaceae bacterium]|nr:MAG: response regulator transcription factor [Flavobacteriaceae bacterium]